MKPAISIADVLRAFQALAPQTEEEKRAIAEVLGFTLAPVAVTVGGEPPPPEAVQPIKPPPPLRFRPNILNRPNRMPATTASAAGFTISGPESRGEGGAPWAAAAAQRGEFDAPWAPAVTIAAVPLFEPRWNRAILSTALGVQGPVGRVNVAQIVDEVARGRPLRKLPRFPGNLVAPFVEILLDVGDSMMPYAQDQRELVSAVQTVVGAGSVRTLKFMGSPLRGAGTDEDETWPDYLFPAPGVHLLLLTDFGIGRPPVSHVQVSAQEWRRFADVLRRRKLGCTAFVPYPPARWPVKITRYFRTVEWDRGTTAGSVKFSRRPGTV
jgi:hypothetical protein